MSISVNVQYPAEALGDLVHSWENVIEPSLRQRTVTENAREAIFLAGLHRNLIVEPQMSKLDKQVANVYSGVLSYVQSIAKDHKDNRKIASHPENYDRIIGRVNDRIQILDYLMLKNGSYIFRRKGYHSEQQ